MMAGDLLHFQPMKDAVFVLWICFFVATVYSQQPSYDNHTDTTGTHDDIVSAGLPWKLDRGGDDDMVYEDTDSDYDSVEDEEDDLYHSNDVDDTNGDKFLQIHNILTKTNKTGTRTESSSTEIRCAQYKAPKSSGGSGKNSESKRISENGTETELSVNYTIVTCKPDWRCFTLWQTDPEQGNKLEIKSQGCWHRFENKCEKALCLADQGRSYSHFCCCNSDMCNTQFKDIKSDDPYLPQEHTTKTAVVSTSVGPLLDNGYREKTIIIALVSVIGVAFVVIFTYLPYRLCLTTKPVPISHHSGPTGGGPTTDHTRGYSPLANVDLDLLKFDEVLSRGHFSEVWKGSLGSEEVAIKVYHPSYKQYYLNECNCYTLPFMSQENVVKFYGGREQCQGQGQDETGSNDSGSSIQGYLLVLDYYPLGSLNGYLKQHTVEWTLLFSMGHDISRGLSHLHNDIQLEGRFKPALAHRDLNTRNILVSSDLRCVLTDLGFCTAMMGSKLLKNGTMESTGQTSLAEVGTIRYLAPEVFDGAVNLRDCEASLKQVDVYSLGLVLWEVASRCIHLYQGAPMPDYQLPFQAEAGLHPSFVEMQSLVVRYKTRPKFPEVWKDTNPAVRCLKETIEDCWDSDPEARLTALCVQERFSDMAGLWLQGSRQRGVTPTLNTTKNLAGGHYSSSSPGAFISNGMAFLPEFLDKDNGDDRIIGSHQNQSEYRKEELSSSLNSTMKDVPANVVVEVDDDNDILDGCNVTSPLINGQLGYDKDSHCVDKEELSSSAAVIDVVDRDEDDYDDGGRGCNRRSLTRDVSMSGSTVDTWLIPTPTADDLDDAAFISVLSDKYTSPRNSSTYPHNNTSSSSSPSFSTTTAATTSSVVKTSNVTLAMNTTVLHPHQGRNPTVERNTHKCSDEELTVSGNRLIGPGHNNNNNIEAMSLMPMKSSTLTRSEHIPPISSAQTNRLSTSHATISIYDNVVDAESSSLVQNDSLNYLHQHRNAAPIPYVQNQVSSASSNSTNGLCSNHYPTRPTKMANVVNVNDVCMQQPQGVSTVASSDTNVTNVISHNPSQVTSPLGQALSEQHQQSKQGQNKSKSMKTRLSKLMVMSPRSIGSKILSRTMRKNKNDSHRGNGKQQWENISSSSTSYSPTSIQAAEVGGSNGSRSSNAPRNDNATGEYFNSGLETTPTRRIHDYEREDLRRKNTQVQLMNGSVITDVIGPSVCNASQPVDISNEDNSSNSLGRHHIAFTNSNPDTGARFKPSPTVAISGPNKISTQTNGMQLPLNVMVPTQCPRKPHQNVDIESETLNSHHRLNDSDLDEASTSFNSGEVKFVETNTNGNVSTCVNPMTTCSNENVVDISKGRNSPSSTNSTNSYPFVYAKDNNYIDISQFNKFNPNSNDNKNNKNYKDKNDYSHSRLEEKDKLLKKDKFYPMIDHEKNSCENPNSSLPSTSQHGYPPLSTNLRQLEEDEDDLSSQRLMSQSCFVPIHQPFDDSFVSSSASSVVIPMSRYEDDRFRLPTSNEMATPEKKSHSQPMTNGYNFQNFVDAVGKKNTNENLQHDELSTSFERDNEREMALQYGKNGLSVNVSSFKHHQSRPQSLPIKVFCSKDARHVDNENLASTTASVKPPKTNSLVSVASNYDRYYPLTVPTVSLDKIPPSTVKNHSARNSCGSGISAVTNSDQVMNTNKEENNSNSSSKNSGRSSSKAKSEIRSISLKEGRHRSDSGEKIRRRIKTPVSFKTARLSLYDDRLMMGENTDAKSAECLSCRHQSIDC